MTTLIIIWICALLITLMAVPQFGWEASKYATIACVISTIALLLAKEIL